MAKSKFHWILGLLLIIIGITINSYLVNGATFGYCTSFHNCPTGWQFTWTAIPCVINEDCQRFPDASSAVCIYDSYENKKVCKISGETMYFCEPTPTGFTGLTATCSVSCTVNNQNLGCNNNIGYCRKIAGTPCLNTNECMNGLYCSHLGYCDIDLVNKKYFAIQYGESITTYDNQKVGLIITDEGNAFTNTWYSGVGPDKDLCEPQTSYSSLLISPLFTVKNIFNNNAFKVGLYPQGSAAEPLVNSAYPVSSLPTTSDSLIIKNSANEIVSTIKNDGHFYIKGRVMDDLCYHDFSLKVKKLPKCGDGVVDSRWEECERVSGVGTCQSGYSCNNCRCVWVTGGT